MTVKPQDTVNRRRLILALIPFIVSVGMLAGVYYYFNIYKAEPQTVVISAGVPGSATYGLIETIAARLSRSRPELKVKLLATSGTEANIKLLENGTVDIAAIPADALARPSFALIANLFPDTYHVIVHSDSNISSIHGLAGKRIAVPPLSASAYRSFWFLIGQYGINPESILAKPMSAEHTFDAIRKRNVDAAFYMAPPANKRTRWLAEAARIRILDIDQAHAMSLRRPSLVPVTIPKGTYGGKPPIPARKIQTVAAQRILITRKGFSSEIINAITAIMFEQRRDLSAASRMANFITAPKTDGATILPVHAGAAAFYNRDQPTFLQENAEVIGVMFSILIVLSSGLLWVKRRWEEHQKGRIDVYNLELAQLSDQASGASSLASLEQYKKTLFDMLPRVIRDLDEDNIDGEGFHYFAFTWQAALSVITEKQNELKASKTTGRKVRGKTL